MTQKELLYVEDAIGHEKVMIEVIKSTIEMLEDEELKIFMEDELKLHEQQQNKLMTLLEEEYE